MKFRTLLLTVCSAAALVAAMPEARALEMGAGLQPDRSFAFVVNDVSAGPAVIEQRGFVPVEQALKPREPRAAEKRSGKTARNRGGPQPRVTDATPSTAPKADCIAQTADAQATPPAGDNLEVLTLRARAQLGLGQLNAARDTANAVLARDPNNVEALRVLGAVEESANRWRYAATAWDRVYQVSNDPAAARRRDELMHANGSSVSFGAFFEGAFGADEQYGARANAEYHPLNGPAWSAMLENRHAENDIAVALDGTVGPISMDRQRLEIGVGDAFTFARMSARVIATNDDVGARASIGRTFVHGSADLTLGYNEPYWLFSEGLANQATTDYVQVAATARSHRLGLRGNLRYSNYGVEDDDKVASSVRVTAGAEYSLSDGRNPWIVSYVVDGEYYSDIDVRTRPNLTTYTAMPFVDREVHSLGVYKTVGDTQHNFANFGAGYRADRLGAEGPFASVWTEHEVGNNVRLGARLEYSKPSIRGSADDQSWGFAEFYVRRAF